MRIMKMKKANNNNIIKDMIERAEAVYNRIKGTKQPELEFPLRSLANVSYGEEKGYFELNGKVQ